MFTEPEAPDGLQWWRIEYDVNASGTRILQTKSSEDEVIRAVELEHNQALLIYASDSAIEHDADPVVPEALREFVRRDDELFNSEISFSAPHQYTTAAYNDIEDIQPRRSIDSTVVNFDDDRPPAYDDEPAMDTFTDEKEPLLSRQFEDQYDQSPPTHEIRLEDDLMGDESYGGLEMAEKNPGALLGDAGIAGNRRTTSDTSMTDVGNSGSEIDETKTKVD